MFKLALNPTYAWPVSVEIPTDGGKYETATFQAIFKRGTVQDYEDFYKRMESGELSFVEAARQIVHGWEDVLGDEGKPVEFTPEALEKLLSIPRFAEAIFWAYVNSATGAKIKN